MKSHIAVAWALGILGGAMFVTGLVRTMRKPEPAPTLGQVSERDVTPASLDDVLDLSGKVTGNVATSNVTTGNFVVSTNLTFQKHKNVTLDADSFETITIPGHHVITQAEAEEVVKLLSDHAGNLESFLEQLRQDRRTADAAKIGTDLIEAKATLAKWRKRVEEGKPSTLSVSMKPLDEHNRDAAAQIPQQLTERANSIKCPKCDAELWDDLTRVLTSNPPQTPVSCKKCGYSGSRL